MTKVFPEKVNEGEAEVKKTLQVNSALFRKSERDVTRHTSYVLNYVGRLLTTKMLQTTLRIQLKRKLKKVHCPLCVTSLSSPKDTLSKLSQAYLNMKKKALIRNHHRTKCLAIFPFKLHKNNVDVKELLKQSETKQKLGIKLDDEIIKGKRELLQGLKTESLKTRQCQVCRQKIEDLGKFLCNSDTLLRKM